MSKEQFGTLEGFISYIKSSPEKVREKRDSFESNKSKRKDFASKFRLEKLTIDDLLDGQGSESFVYKIRYDNLGIMSIRGAQPIIKKEGDEYKKNLIKPPGYSRISEEEKYKLCEELKIFINETNKQEPDFKNLETNYFYRHKAFMTKMVCVYSEEDNYLSFNVSKELKKYQIFFGKELTNPFELSHQIVKSVKLSISELQLNGIIISELLRDYLDYKYELVFDNKIFLENEAKTIFKEITKQLVKKYRDRLAVTDGEPTFTKVLGNKPKNDQIRFEEIENGIYLYTNLKPDDIRTKIEELNNHLDDKINIIRWNNSLERVTEDNLEEKEEMTNISNDNNKLTSVNTILYGPPGTGKTYNSIIYAVKTINPDFSGDYNAYIGEFNRLKEEGQIAFTTFHQSYGYEEFIEGIKPKTKDGQITYEVEAGVFKKFCEKATDDKDKKFVFIIDEINRGNMSKIFGELITLIEDSKREGADEAMSVSLPYSGENFTVPNNVYILGTMNTADRSIALMDTALRRRFEFVEMMPDTSALAGVEVDGIKIDKMLQAMNKRIELLYDREHTLGHAFFMGLKKEPTIDNLAKIFQNKIIPLLQEYFYEDYKKIMAVLGIKGESKEEGKFISLSPDSNDDFIKQFTDVTETYQLNAEAFFEPTNYLAIYGDQLEGGNGVKDEVEPN